MKRVISIAIILSLLLVFPCSADGAYAADSAASAEKPAATSITKYSIGKTSFTMSWKKVKGASGYEIQYCADRFFLNPKTVKVKDPSVTSKTVKISKMSPCYLRIRSYRTVKVEETETKSDSSAKSTKNTTSAKTAKSAKTRTLCSAWTASSNTKISKEAIIVRLTKTNGKDFELRSAAKQKLKKYDTLQGGCTYGSYGWFILYNRNVSKCKLVKMNMKTMKVLKVSSVLNITHGSSVAYNPDTKEVAVAHGPGGYKKVSLIDPNELTVRKVVTLSLPRSTSGVSKKYAKRFKGITALTYNRNHNLYVARVKSQGNLIYYDKNFKAVKYVKLKVRAGEMYQAMDSIGENILMVCSPYGKNKYNRIVVYNWKGQYQSTVRLCMRYEVETVFHRGHALYAGYYRSYYRTYYLDKWRIRVYNGKKNKIKTRFKYTKLMRDNYFFKITDL